MKPKIGNLGNPNIAVKAYFWIVIGAQEGLVICITLYVSTVIDIGDIHKKAHLIAFP